MELSHSDQTLRPVLQRAVEALSPGFDAFSALIEFPESCLGRADYSWTRPNPRYLPSGIYLPALSSAPDFESLVVAIDTSASIQDRHLRFIAGACEEILLAFPNTVLRIVYCDSEIRGTRDVTAHDLPLSLSDAQGGGGTRFSPVFEWTVATVGCPSLLIYLTDLRCFDRPAPPPFPVLWLSISEEAPSLDFGTRIDLTLPPP